VTWIGHPHRYVAAQLHGADEGWEDGAHALVASPRDERDLARRAAVWGEDV
jgi:hypothetical protein